MNTRSVFFLAILFLLAAGALPADEPVSVGVLRGPTAIAFAPLISNDAGGADDLQFEVFPSPDVLVARIIASEIDAATIPSNLAVQLYNRGVPLQVVGTFIWGVLYVVGPPLESQASGEPQSNLQALSGEEVYVPGRGATPDLVFRYLVNRADVDPPVAVRYGFSQIELAQLLIGNRLEYAVLPEPFVTRVLEATDNRVVVADLQEEWSGETGSSMPQTVLVSVGAMDSASRARLLAALEGSVSELLDNPVMALSGVESLGLGLDAQTALAALPRLNLRVESGARSRSDLENYFGVLAEFDPAAIGGGLPDGDFYGM